MRRGYMPRRPDSRGADQGIDRQIPPPRSDADAAIKEVEGIMRDAVEAQVLELFFHRPFLTIPRSFLF